MNEQLEKPITLLQLTTMVSKVVKANFAVPYWVQAELSEVRATPAGHCYLELLEKEAQNNAPIARCRATIWARTWLALQMRFEQETGQPLVAGLKVLVCVTIEFHSAYGFSLNVLDVDPSYTMGDLQKRRREILLRLAAEGVLNDNKSLEMPFLLQRIAVISSASAAGYGDFSRQLTENPYGLYFSPELFAAIMQGEQTEQSVLAALDKILLRIDEFDLVIIIRGGGAVSDLTGFDTYLLAAAVAQFPLPILTGIGHERDDTVLDMVAHTRVKTPTAAAQFLITHQQEIWFHLLEMQASLKNTIPLSLQQAVDRFASISDRVTRGIPERILREEKRLSDLRNRTSQEANLSVLRHQHVLELLTQRLDALKPDRILERGYSLTTTKEGHILTSSKKLMPGTLITTRFSDGEVVSRIEENSN